MKFKAASESIMDSESDGCLDSDSYSSGSEVVLDASTSSGSSLLSLKELVKCCDPKYSS